MLGVMDSPSGAREVHSSALEAALHRVSSRATDNTAKTGYNRRLSTCAEKEGSNLGRTFTESSASSLSWKQRIRHVTWAYFTLTMATGGLANVLYEGKCSLPRVLLSKLYDTHHQQCLIVSAGWTRLELSSS